MKIGIISDTHGNIPATEKAARHFLKEKVGSVLHCGDIGGFDTLAELAAVLQPLDIQIYAVFGNVDTYSGDWKFFPSNIGVQLLGRFGEVTFGGKSMAILHSDDRSLFLKTVESGEYDFIFTGHSHEVHDYTVGQTRCINPGTAGRGAPNTCAVLDLSTGKLEIKTC
jgi:putative phosphoesterase